MLRNLIIPVILVGGLSIPFLMPLNSNRSLPPSGSGSLGQSAIFQSPDSGNRSSVQILPTGNSADPTSPFRIAAAQSTTPPAPRQSAGQTVTRFAPGNGSASTTAGVATTPIVTGRGFPIAPDASWAGPVYDENGQVIGFVPGPTGVVTQPTGVGGTPNPDFGAAQTFTLPGSAAGPDFSAQPLEFTPVTNLDEIFNYRVNSAWLQNRWSRVSNAPAADGLRGQRVALVTGTQSWDLHGSLTYYFDRLQRCRRITFRGWTGDATQLTRYLTQQHGLKQHPTRWTGLYLAKNWRRTTGGLLMKSPTVTFKENTVQRIGVLIELNNPQTKLALSQDFQSLVQGSQ